MEYGYALQMNQSHMKYMKDGYEKKKLKTNNGKYTENMFFFVL